MKKIAITVVYWLAAIFLTAILLTSLDYDLGHAVIMALSFLPAAMTLSFFLPQVERTPDRKERLLNSAFIILGVMTATFFLIYLFQLLFILVLDRAKSPSWDLPSMLWNPVFVAAVLAILAYGHYRLTKWLERRFPSDHPITFTSNYKKVSVKKADILFVESRDLEVWLVTRDGQQYRNKTGISQWEDLLGPDFLRIHRSYLVNVADSVLSSPDTVLVAGKELPVSRKYKENVKTVLVTSQEAGPESPASNKNL